MNVSSAGLLRYTGLVAKRDPRLQARIEAKNSRERFFRARRAEIQYAIQLRSVAGQVARLVAGFADRLRADPGDIFDLVRSLHKYGDAITEWSGAVADRMIREVASRDEKAWAELSIGMSRALKKEIGAAPTAELFQNLRFDQVQFITSLPRHAAYRIQNLAETGGTAEQMLETGEMVEDRATMIARTEVGKVATSFTQVRSIAVGSEGYVWRTMLDREVRPSHRAMEGQVVKWNSPPTLDRMVGHAGEFPNCRCWPDPVIPDAAR